ncbi:hypothetical protein [Flavobacterium nitratireducens]|uniref:hypothetical protein n=1 Tax=Flavobacterium nitratireducens TaxID=992289 RepID=UPI0024150035|nr:hypothetical protein [Flavobacterium nitratireducens]
MQHVPIQISPHLVPFFFKESEGKEYSYSNRKVRTVLFSTTISTIGRIIRLLMVKAGRPVNVENFNLCLTVSDNGNSKKYTGQFYKQENGTNSFLMLPPEANKDINDFLEDMFRMSFISYMNGVVENNNEAVVRAAIDKFIDKYELLEFGFCNDTLRQLYYREKKRVKYWNDSKPNNPTTF